MIRLSQEQIDQKIKFISNYIGASNAADGSKMDANANVSSKNIATMEFESFRSLPSREHGDDNAKYRRPSAS